MARVGNVHEFLDGHVALYLECLDRIYLNTSSGRTTTLSVRIR